ncbi:MAG: 50S ribosomal protein L22 [Actinomycetota bacterium]
MNVRLRPEAQEALASARFIRMSPTKVRQVMDLIRGRHVDDARRVLRYTRRGAAAPVGKVLESAIANAEHNRGLPGDELVVARAWVDEGPTLKRFRPRAQGRATRIRKRTCHISIVVGRLEEEPQALGRAGGLETGRGGTKETSRRVRKTTADETPSPKKAAGSGAKPAAVEPEQTSKTAKPRRRTGTKAAAGSSGEKKTTRRKTTRRKKEEE